MKSALRRLTLALGIAASASGSFPAAAQAATLVHTNDVMGEIEPCGCRENPLGGLARLYNLLKRSPDQQMILVDAGDLLFPTDVVPPLLAEQSVLQAGYLLKGLDLVHEDAIVPGEKDFALGVKTFDQLRAKAHVKFLAANIAKGGKAYLPGHLVVTRKDEAGKSIKVGIFAVVSPSLTWPRELKVTAALEAAKREIAALKKEKVDLIVALTHEPLEEDTKLAQSLPSIGVIVGGHSQSFLETPKLVGQTRIVESSFRNQYVGFLTLPLAPADKVVTKTAEEGAPAQSEDTGDTYKLYGLDAGYGSAEGVTSPMDTLVADFKKGIADLNLKADAPTTKIVATGKTDAPKYDTFPRCAECHLKQFDFWRHTQHALALNTLVGKNQALNKECLTCHTVGLGKPGGFSSVRELGSTKDPEGESKSLTLLELEVIHPFLKSMHDAESLSTVMQIPSNRAAANPAPSPRPLREALKTLGPFWTPVQCENCHGPGGDHPLSSDPMPKIATTTCLECHNPERAPAWYRDGKPNQELIEAKLKSIACPAGNEE